MADTNQLNDAHEMQASANKEGLNRKQEEGMVKGEARAMMKDLMAEVANPFAISQEQGQQFAKNDSIISDAVGGESIDSKQNLANINAEIEQIKAKIKAIEDKGDSITTDDKREKYALNKKLLELKDLAIKAKQEGRQEAIKAKQDERKQIIEQGNAEYERKQKIIDDKIRAIQSKIK